MIVYLDTSALVKRYIHEEGSEKIFILTDDINNIFGSIGVTKVEMAAALQKAIRTDTVLPKNVSEMWNDFLNHWQSFARLRVTPGTIERACEIAWEYSLRGYDSLHLSAAMLWQEAISTPIVFAAFDHDLWLAGQKAGMQVWPEGLIK